MSRSERLSWAADLRKLAEDLEQLEERAMARAQEAYPSDRTAHYPYAFGVATSRAETVCRLLKIYAERIAPPKRARS